MESRIIGRILVVDDQDNWREALTSLLSTEGYEVRAVSCFEDAAEEISQGVFDVVVLDVRLMDTDVFNVQGLELLRLAKGQEKAPRAMVITGYPESIRDEVLEEYGADALVLKVPPGSRFDSKGFKERVRELL
jgi:two-component system response regulator RegX3